MMTATATQLDADGRQHTAAPLGRLLRSELRWVFRRPRTLVMLGLFGLIPVVIGIAIATSGRAGGPAAGLIAATAGNGMVLPVLALTLSLALLLPLGVSMAAADALAGESAHGTLRGLLLAPMSRDRVVGVKAFGVLAVAVAAVGLITIMGVLTGLLVVGTTASGGQLLTLSGSTVGPMAAAGRVGLAAGYVILQLAAVGAVALVVSSLTDHPLVVMAAVLGGAIVFGVLSAIPALDWLQPALLTSHWTAIADVLRDPVPLGDLARGSSLAVGYLLVGLVLTVVRLRTRDA